METILIINAGSSSLKFQVFATDGSKELQRLIKGQMDGMAVGTPERVVDELVRQEKRNLTVIANDTANPDRGIGKLVAAKRVRKAIVSRCLAEQISGRFPIGWIGRPSGQSCHQWRER